MMTPAQSNIRDGETLVSSSQIFELGFFSPGNSRNRFLGIWYKNTSMAVVWVANRNRPIADSGGVLAINSNGNLILLDGTNNTVWSSNASRKAESPVAQLLDSGNFIVKDNKNTQPGELYLWQSFDYPSDTLLPGMKLGKNLKTGSEWYLTSWKSTDDPSSGNFTLRLSTQGLPYLVAYMGSAKYFRTGPWDGAYFGGTLVSSYVWKPYLVHNKDEIYYSCKTFSNQTITRLNLEYSGATQRLLWNESSTNWDIIISRPSDQCDLFGQCGANAICSINNKKTPICECLEGFRPESDGMYSNNGNLSRTCVKDSSSCQNKDGFLKLARMKLPELADFSLNESMNLNECEMECLKNCSCSAYSSKPDEQDKGCVMWYGNLIDMIELSEEKKGLDIYVRVPSSKIGK
ncbi:hypothetical protein PTKIN_Ptkin11bG0161300 [Pterospermum kingtungense]